jgi:hypothetical protein
LALSSFTVSRGMQIAIGSATDHRIEAFPVDGVRVWQTGGLRRAG